MIQFNLAPVLKLRNLLLILLLTIVSCQEWTPEADGHYTVDGKDYKVHIMYIDEASSGTNNNISVTWQGASGYNVRMFVSVAERSLAAGTYQVTWGYAPMGINSISILRGNTNDMINNDSNSMGTMTVEKTGSHYRLDFSGTIGGRSVKIYYNGLASISRI
jgi:hypothetical protein